MVADLCCGSGCIGLAAAANLPNARVLLGEYDEEALKICRQNIRRNRLTARVASLKIDAREKPARTLGEFQFLVSNPPYIPSADIDTLETNLKKAKENKPLSLLPQIWTDYKKDELANIYKGKGTQKEKESIYELLFNINPSQNAQWDKIKQ